MKVLYYDCFAGISGDMNLGALLDLGVDKEYLLKELSKLQLSHEFDIEVKIDTRKGISGTKADVILHEHHVHEHHHHRNLRDIQHIINSSTLNERVKALSLEMFRKIAIAEGKIHNASLDEVHFHEVGATDSIVDIIGGAICLDYLKIDRILCGPVQLGGGFVKCAHGTFPVPAPATMEILKDIPVKTGLVPFETTTPTGAAILATVVDEFTEMINFKIVKTGYGIGGRDTDIPNVLRIILGETDEKSFLLEEAVVMECNIDDMNPEMYDYVMEKLFKAGAQDVYLTPIIMKKGRPAVTLSVLSNINDEEVFENILLRETSTLGIRKYNVKKKMLQRDIVNIETKYGNIPVKVAFLDGEKIKYKAEYDICKRISQENHVPIQEIYEEVFRKQLEL